MKIQASLWLCKRDDKKLIKKVTKQKSVTHNGVTRTQVTNDDRFQLRKLAINLFITGQ